MSAPDRLDLRVDALGKAARRAALLSSVGAVVVLGALVYAVAGLKSLEQQRATLSSEVSSFEQKVSALRARATDLESTQSDLLAFLGDVTSQESIRFVDPGVDWISAKATILSLPAGPRKSVVLSAILLAWKAVPFSLENRGLSRGLDSPHFVNSVLSRYGVDVAPNSGERLSDAMMRTFEKAESPEPGDLLFYRGNVGSFVVIYVAPGKPGGHGVAVGTLQTGEELRILDTASMNTAVYPFIGVFKVPYRSLGASGK